MNPSFLLLLGLFGSVPEPVDLVGMEQRLLHFDQAGYSFDSSLGISPGGGSGLNLEKLSIDSKAGNSRSSYLLGRILADPRLSRGTADYRESLRLLELAAKQDPKNAVARLWLGNLILEHGEELMRPASTAVDYYLEAAVLGNPKGYVNVSAMYFLGKGVSKNDELALMYAKLAADAGDSEAKGIVANWNRLVEERDRSR